MKNLFIVMVVGLVVAFAGIKIADYASSIVSKESLADQEALCMNAVATKGVLQDHYTENTTRIAKVDMKSYTFTYDFKVNDTPYTATRTSNTPEPILVADIWYHPSDPTKNTVTEPCQELKKIKEEKNVGSSGPFYVVAIIFVLGGLGYAWGAFKNILRRLLNKNP